MGNQAGWQVGNRIEGEALRAADELLRRRANPKWVSLSWTTLRPLISSLNQVLIGASPNLIPHLRQNWTDRLAPPPENRVVERGEADCVLLLGDTGEQDRSQYIVVPALRTVVERERPDFGFLCSDVIYPSGNVNDYVHGLYLPYGPTPPGTDSRLARLPLFAIPGNHDWHDGLSGFMQQFCGTRPLDPAQLGWPTEPLGHGAQWLEATRRMLLRRPDSFQPQPLWRADGDSPYTAPMTLEQFRALRGPFPGQPGSYYAIRTRDLLLVAIDTGVGLGDGASAIDARQGLWLERVSALPGPKVLLTGNPLLVNAEHKQCRIEPAREGAQAQQSRFATVNQVVDDPAHQYVAVIAGDIHNFQHYVAEATPGPSTSTRVVHHVVSGGGGAYMSATHPVRVVQQLRRRAQESRQERTPPQPPSTTWPDDPPVPHSMVPTPVESLQHFTRLLLPRLWRLERAILATLAAAAATAAADRRLPARAERGWLLAGLVGVLLALVLVRVAVPADRLRRPGIIGPHRALLVAWSALAGACLTVAVTWLDPRHGMRHLAGWAALTVGGCVVAWAIRQTGWWRPPVRPDEKVAPRTLIGGAVAWPVSIVLAWWLGQLALRDAELPARVAGLPASWLPMVPAAAVAAVGGLGVLSFLARPRTPLPPPRPAGSPAAGSGTGTARAWARWAPPASYLVQILAAVLVATYTLYPEAASLPWAVVCGLLALPLTLTVALVFVAAGLRLACRTAGGQWRRRWGEWGRWGRTGIGLAVLGLLALQLAASAAPGSWVPQSMVTTGVLAAVAALVLFRVARRGRSAAAAAGAAVLAVSELGFVAGLDGAARLSTYRVQLGTQLTVVTAVLMIFLIDSLRRRRRGRRGYSLQSVLAVAALGVVIWAIDGRLGWVVRSAVASVAVIMVVTITLVTVHLAYLGAFTLVLDRQAHRDGGPELLTADEAQAFLAWRVDTSQRSPLPRLRQWRARIVFPSTGNPHGPIQRKVSEIFDSDDPPFRKNFLILRTRPGRLLIDVYIVRGDATIAEDARPKLAIVVPLPDGPQLVTSRVVNRAHAASQNTTA